MFRKDGVNILIVDDIPDKLLALEAALEELEQNVITARSGPEALRHLLEHDFAVILLDVNMPGMDGFETAMLIRQHRRCAQTPIIFVTAFSDDLHTTRGYSLGAVDYILSPVVPEILRTKVKVFVDLFEKTEQVKRHAEERIAVAGEQAARLAAEEASRRKDEFLAMLSHELRNPLAPIRNALHLLRLSRVEDPAVIEARDVIDRQVQQLARLVDDLLDVFRITHRKITLHRETLDLAQLVRLTAEDHRSGLESARLHLTMELPEEPVWVLADRTRLAQVLSNLLHNAIKFTNAGGQVTVCIDSHAETERVIVTVSDTGIGIAPEVLPYVFETFTQADQSLDRSRGGLGLGLALVKGIIELHDGQVEASSPGLGRGTAMRFWLPLDKKPHEETIHHPVNVPAARRLRILIVEDHRDTVRTLATLLGRYGHDVKMAHTGPAGVDLAR